MSNFHHQRSPSSPTARIPRPLQFSGTPTASTSTTSISVTNSTTTSATTASPAHSPTTSPSNSTSARAPQQQGYSEYSSLNSSTSSSTVTPQSSRGTKRPPVAPVTIDVVPQVDPYRTKRNSAIGSGGSRSPPLPSEDSPRPTFDEDAIEVIDNNRGRQPRGRGNNNSTSPINTTTTGSMGKADGNYYELQERRALRGTAPGSGSRDGFGHRPSGSGSRPSDVGGYYGSSPSSSNDHGLSSSSPTYLPYSQPTRYPQSEHVDGFEAENPNDDYPIDPIDTDPERAVGGGYDESVLPRRVPPHRPQPKIPAARKIRHNCCCGLHLRTCIVIWLILLICAGIIIYFVWPRPPHILYQGIKVGSGGYTIIPPVNPSSIRANWTISLAVSNGDGWVPLRLDNIKLVVNDLSGENNTSGYPIGEGNLGPITLPATKDNTIVSLDFALNYVSSNSSDPVISDLFKACGGSSVTNEGEQTQTTLNVKFETTIYIWGLSWLYRPSVTIPFGPGLTCPLPSGGDDIVLS